MYVCGKNVAREYLMENNKIEEAFLYSNFKDDNIETLLKEKEIPVHYLEKRELDKLTSENHQGIVLKIEDFKYSNIEDVIRKDNPLLVMLDHIQDPHNLGAIIRTCEAAGVDGIVLPKDRSVLVNATVVRTSVGASKHIPIILVTNLVQTMKELKKIGFWFFGTDMDGESYSKLNYKGKTCLIIGSEGSGMSRLVRDNCDFIASIPMNGKINSLNASVATGVIVYGAVRNRNEL